VRRSRWLAVAGYGALAAVLLACLWLMQWIPMRLGWGRELLAAAIAIVAMTIGIALASRRSPAPVAPLPAPPLPPVSDLSVREREVLALLARGLSNKELARELSVSENTVKTHLANLYAKLGARRRTEALATARRMGLPEAG
jgi:DNA-binding NarL/FixJ family response regulator